MLELIDQRHKGPAVNEILIVIRTGLTDMAQIKLKIRENVMEHLLKCEHWGNEVSDYWYILRDHIHEADADIQKYLDYEKLSPEEKQKLKQGKGQFFAKESMRDKPPTEAQIKYLLSLGYKGDVKSLTRLDVSVLIDNLCK